MSFIYDGIWLLRKERGIYKLKDGARVLLSLARQQGRKVWLQDSKLIYPFRSSQIKVLQLSSSLLPLHCTTLVTDRDISIDGIKIVKSSIDAERRALKCSRHILSFSGN